MVYGNGGAAAAAAAQAAIAQAVKASGAIIRVEPDAFMIILAKVDVPLVVSATGGVFKKDFRYLTSYKGLIFFTKSSFQLILPGRAEIIAAKEIWIPA
jgi:hypothetical protein